jgi:hypothetical protein
VPEGDHPYAADKAEDKAPPGTTPSAACRTGSDAGRAVSLAIDDLGEILYTW